MPRQPNSSQTTPGPAGIVPAEPVASPGEIPRSDAELCWYRPGWGETARRMGWRWLYAAPTAALVALLAYVPWRPAVLQLLLPWWKLWVILVALPIGAFINAAQHAIRGRRDPFCIHCGYSLTGLPDGHACPECGRTFRLRIIEEYRRDPRWFIQRHRLGRDHLPSADVPFDVGPAKGKRRRSRDGT